MGAHMLGSTRREPSTTEVINPSFSHNGAREYRYAMEGVDERLALSLPALVVAVPTRRAVHRHLMRTSPQEVLHVSARYVFRIYPRLFPRHLMDGQMWPSAAPWFRSRYVQQLMTRVWAALLGSFRYSEDTSTGITSLRNSVDETGGSEAVVLLDACELNSLDPAMILGYSLAYYRFTT